MYHIEDLFFLFPLTLFRGPISGFLNGKLFHFVLFFQFVRSLVDEALVKFSADKTGLADYALESGGKSDSLVFKSEFRFIVCLDYYLCLSHCTRHLCQVVLYKEALCLKTYRKHLIGYFAL